MQTWVCQTMKPIPFICTSFIGVGVSFQTISLKEKNADLVFPDNETHSFHLYIISWAQCFISNHQLKEYQKFMLIDILPNEFGNEFCKMIANIGKFWNFPCQKQKYNVFF